MNEDSGQVISDYVSLTIDPAIAWPVLAKRTDQLPSFFKLALRAVDGTLYSYVPSAYDIMNGQNQPVGMALAFLSASTEQRMQRRDYLENVFKAHPQVVTNFEFGALRP